VFILKGVLGEDFMSKDDCIDGQPDKADPYGANFLACEDH